MQTNLGWEEKPLGSLCNFTNGYAFKPSDWRTLGKPIIRIQNLNEGKDFNYFQGVLPNRYEIKPGTLLFAWSGNRGTSFGPFIWNGPTGFLNQHIFKVTPEEGIDERWFFYALDEVRQRVERDAHGAIGLVHVRKQDLCKYSVFFPKNSSEQCAIAAILDSMDEAIRQTEAVIAKLRQVKAGMLHDLLTRGLDENGELRDPRRHPEQFKDSTLGCIPKVWEVTSCAEICNEISVGIVVRPTQYYVNYGVPALRSFNIKEDGIWGENLVFISPQSNTALKKSQIYTGNVVTVRTGYPGTSAVVTEEYNESNCIDLVISRPSNKISGEFLSLWINSDYGKEAVLCAQGGLAQQHFNVGDLAKLKIIVPSVDEQNLLVKRIASLKEDIRLQEKILMKYALVKQGLMHDLLTGSVRVPPHLLEKPP